MKINLGLAILSAAALATLGGCMGANTDSASQANSNRKVLDFASNASQSLAKVSAAEQPQQPGGAGGMGQVDIAAAMRSAGVCEKFIGLVEDMANCGNGSCDDGLPQSVLDFVSCFGIKINGNGSIEDIDTLSAAVANFSQFQSCVCGGSGSLFGSFSYDDLKWQTFSGSASAAAGAAFSGSQSNPGGAAFNGSSSAAGGSAFNGSQSNPVGKPFSGK
jgi:hypothetical protein